MKVTNQKKMKMMTVVMMKVINQKKMKVMTVVMMKVTNQMKVMIIALKNVVLTIHQAFVMKTVWNAKMVGIMKVVIKIFAKIAWIVKHVMLKDKKITGLMKKTKAVIYHHHLLTKHLKMVNVGVIAKM